jgi:hypothetical protein
VKIQDINILNANEYLKGSAGQMPKNIESHTWYFNSITACAVGTWLEGELPSNEDFAGIAVGFLENWAWGMVDSIWNTANDVLGKALGYIGINAKPKIPSPTVLIPQEYRKDLVSWLTGNRSSPPNPPSKGSGKG